MQVTTLEPWSDGVWTASAPHTMFGLHLGTRMTVVRLANGDLLVHSPIARTPELRAAVDALGPVRHIVCPNLFHHTYAEPWVTAYPNAVVHAPPELAAKRRDLRIDAPFGPTTPPSLAADVVFVPVEGTMLKETHLVHPASRTVLSADLVENFATSDHLPTRLYLKAAGLHGRTAWSPLLRGVYRDRRAARRGLDALLEHEFDRALIAHGDPIRADAKNAVRDAFNWL